MRGTISDLVPVRDIRKLYIRIVDMRGVNQDEIFVGKRPLACRFDFCRVTWKILLTLLFVVYVGSVLTVFLDLFVSGIRGLGTSRKKLKLMADPTFFPTSGPWTVCVLSFWKE